MTWKTLSAYLFHYMKGKSLGAFADQLGVHKTRLSDWLTNPNVKPREHNIKKVIECLEEVENAYDAPLAPHIFELAGKPEEADRARAYQKRLKKRDIGHSIEEPRSQYTAYNVPIVGFVYAGRAEIDFAPTDGDYPVGASHKSIEIIACKSLPKGAYAVLVKDDSMYPDIKEGDILIIDPEGPFLPNREYVIRTHDDDAWVKVVNQHDEKYILKSYNPDYPPIYLDKKDVRSLHPVWGLWRQGPRLSPSRK